MEIGLAQLLQILSILASIIVAVILAINTKASKSEEKNEATSTQLILSKIELSEARMMGKLDSLTKGQNTMEKKIEEMEKDLKERVEDSHDKDQKINNMAREIRENKEWIEELKGRLKHWEQSQGMKNITDLVLKTNDKNNNAT